MWKSSISLFLLFYKDLAFFWFAFVSLPQSILEMLLWLVHISAIITYLVNGNLGFFLFEHVLCLFSVKAVDLLNVFSGQERVWEVDVIN